MKVLSTEEKLKFVRTSVSWIQGKDTMDTCFILNYGYEAPLPWPQVKILFYEGSNLNDKQVRLRLDTEKTENGLKLVPESLGMNVPSTCTIVIIAGKYTKSSFVFFIVKVMFKIHFKTKPF